MFLLLYNSTLGFTEIKIEKIGSFKIDTQNFQKFIKKRVKSFEYTRITILMFL